MKSKRTTLGILFFVFLTIPQVANANSSWIWISETRPYDLLPIVAIATILIEVNMIKGQIKPGNRIRLVGYVVGANLVSFLFPYAVNYSHLVQVYWELSLREMFERTPAYTVGFWFLVMTIVIELPIVYFGLREKTDNKEKLRKIIIGTNIVTTIMVALVERMFCQGHW